MKDESRIKRKLKRGRQLTYLGLKSLKKDGVLITSKKALRALGFGKTLAYRRWAKKPLYTETELQSQRQRQFSREVKFSIITPLYNTQKNFLHDMIDSVLAQTYPNWELCLADGSDFDHDDVERICHEYAAKDQRIKYRKLDGNYGIVGNSNACIEMADGDYISILDHDDILHPAALHDVMEKICEEDADFIYTDELIFAGSDTSKVYTIHFKKDFAPDDLLANNYICHFTSFQRELLDRCGAFCEGFDGSQDHELFLRLTDAARSIAHIPKPLYYWRAHGGSVAQSADNKSYAGEAGKKAIRKHLKSKGIAASVDNAKEVPTVYRVSYALPAVEPAVRILIPSYDHVDDLSNCIRSILEKTTYSNYEITIIENNSTEPATFEYYETISREHSNIQIIEWKGESFNWSAINNFAVREAARETYLLFLNNDTEVIAPDWIQEMIMHAQRPQVGAVGAMLYYPDDTIQHAGVIIGLGGEAGHAASAMRRGNPGYMGRLCYAQDLSAVTGACLMVRRSVFEESGGFDERFAVRFNDTDFCLRLHEAGYLNIWTPYAELYHFESKSRGVYDTAEDRKQADEEKALFRERWGRLLEEGDPYFNPNLSLMRSDFEPRLFDQQ